MNLYLPEHVVVCVCVFGGGGGDTYVTMYILWATESWIGVWWVCLDTKGNEILVLDTIYPFTEHQICAKHSQHMYCVWTHTKGKGQKVSMHRFPAAGQIRRQQWLSALNLKEEDFNDNSRVCSRHFMYGDVSNLPTLHLGWKYASPKKPEGVWTKRALKRHTTTLVESKFKRSKSQLSSGSSSCPVTPALSDSYDEDIMSEEPLSVSIGEQLFSDYSVHELPNESTRDDSHRTLSARIDALEAETRQLKATQANQKAVPWRISCTSNDDELIRFYSGPLRTGSKIFA